MIAVLFMVLMISNSFMSQANFEHGFGVVDSGGFVKCDLAADGVTMAGCTAKGHLIQWDISTELRKSPNGQMLYQWLASMPNALARTVYATLVEHYPLMYNAQDSRGWTVLMHAASDSNAEVIKVIIANIRPGHGSLGLLVSPLRRLAGVSGKPGRASTALLSMGSNDSDAVKGGDLVSFSAGGKMASDILDTTEIEEADQGQEVVEPNSITIAIEASSGDCVHHILHAVLAGKVTDY